MRQGPAVDGLELPADRHSVRDARRFDARAQRDLAQIMRGGLAFDRRIGGENDLAHFGLRQQSFELLQPELRGPDAVERRQMPHQYEVTPPEAAGLLDGHDVRRRFDHAELRGTALRGGAYRAEF